MRYALIAMAVAGLLAVGLSLTIGAGGFRRMVTVTGIYSICKPDGYDVVCFLDADGREGGLSCLPLSVAGGGCRK